LTIYFFSCIVTILKFQLTVEDSDNHKQLCIATLYVNGESGSPQDTSRFGPLNNNIETTEPFATKRVTVWFKLEW